MTRLRFNRDTIEIRPSIPTTLSKVPFRYVIATKLLLYSITNTLGEGISLHRMAEIPLHAARRRGGLNYLTAGPATGRKPNYE